MVKCEVCFKEFSSLRGLSFHLKGDIKNCGVNKPKTIEDYYVKFFNVGVKPTCPICGGEVKFCGLGKGFNKYCSSKCSAMDPDGKSAREITSKKRYGTKYPLQNDILKNKMIRTRFKEKTKNEINIEAEKRRTTNIIRYGTDNPSKNDNIKRKISKSRIKRSDREKQAEIYKRGKTLKERYENSIYFKTSDFNRKKKEYYKKEMIYKIENGRLGKYIEPMDDICKEYDGVTKKYRWKCKKCNTIFLDSLEDGKIPRCPECYPYIYSGTSVLENEVYDFCKSLSIDAIRNNSDVIPPFEIDIYIPSSKYGIEVNGLYWHSEINGKKNKKYHLKKTTMCKDSGINLIHIFEDEWLNKQEIVKSIIKNKLNKNVERIFARNCEINRVENDQAKNFLEKNHIQGYIKSKIHIGLYYHKELISIISMGTPRFSKKHNFEILRFCTRINTNVLGGFSKMYKWFLKESENISVVTYSDLRFGTGNVYLKNGFKFLNQTPPSYFYINKNRGDSRFSRMRFQKHKLDKLLETFDPNLTAWQNMQLNGYDRIWDCGCNVFEKV